MQKLLLQNDNFFRYDRGAVSGSINLPFASVQLSQNNVEVLPPQIKQIAGNKENVVVIIGPNDENNCLVRKILILQINLSIL